MLLNHQHSCWPAKGAAPSLPKDVVRLVIAARHTFDLGYSDEAFGELDKALEAFSERVPYDKE